MRPISDTPITEPRSLDQVPNAPKRSEPVGFLLRLSKALHTYGLPAYELENTINACAYALNYGIQCISTPTSITMTIMPPDNEVETYVIRVAPGRVDLSKLHEVTEVAEQVISGELSSASGAAAIKSIAEKDSNYSNWLTLLAFMLASAGIARIFSGGANEMFASGVVGLLVGILTHASRNNTFLDHLLPTISAFMATMLAFCFNHWLLPQMSLSVVVISGLIILLPGLSLTIAMAELATQNVVSGTARLMSAMTVFIQLAFGAAIAFELGKYFFSGVPAATLAEPASLWSIYLAVAVVTVSLIPVFNARAKDTLWVLAASLCAYSSVLVAAKIFGASLGAFCGAIVVGLLAKFASRIAAVPGAVIMMPGFIILVPGSVGYKSILALLEKDIINGLQSAFEVSMIGISLVAGFLISSMLPLPKQEGKDQY